MNMGMSLLPEFLLGIPSCRNESRLLEEFGSVKNMLGRLRDGGVGSIEIRGIKADDREDYVKRLTQIILKEDLDVSIHGKITGENESFLEAYPCMKEYCEQLEREGKSSVFVIHSFFGKDGDLDYYTEKTKRVIRNWCRDDLPLVFALEINRYRDDRVDPSAWVESLMEIMESAPEKNCGLCFDFGHYYYNHTIRQGDYTRIPPPDFLKRTVHTHVHGLKDLQTHHLFETERDLPLIPYIEALKNNGYGGIYNLEFSFERIPEDIDIKRGILNSLKILSEALGIGDW